MYLLDTLDILLPLDAIDNTCDIDLDSCYRICTPKSQTYERAECYLYADFFLLEIVHKSQETSH